MQFGIEDLNLDSPDLAPADGTFKIPEEGRYRLRIVEAEPKRSKADNPMVVLSLEVVSNADSTSAGANTGRRVRAYAVWSKEKYAQERLKNLLLSCKLPINRNFEHDEFVGREFYATVKHKVGTATKDDEGNVRPAPVFANIQEESPI